MSFNYLAPAVTKWKLDEFMAVVNQFEDDLAATVHQIITIENDYKSILAHIAGKSLLTTRELLTLCAFGYPDGALSLSRNLFEQMITIVFFETHRKDANFQDYVNDYMLNYEVQRNKYLRKMYGHNDTEELTKLDAEHMLLKSQSTHRLNGDYWWTGYDSFSTLVSYLIKEHKQYNKNTYDIIYSQYIRYLRCCITLHASCMGNFLRLGKSPEFNIIDTSPSLYGQSTPLVFSAISLITIIAYICVAFHIDNTQYLKHLNELAEFYKNQEKQDINSD